MHGKAARVVVPAASLRIEGRFQAGADGRIELDWPGTTVRACVSGSGSAWLRLAGGHNAFRVRCRERCGALRAERVLVTDGTLRDWLLFDDLPREREVELEVAKRTESRAGTVRALLMRRGTTVVRLDGLVLDGGGRVVALDGGSSGGGGGSSSSSSSSDSSPPRHIEFVGDSDTAAFGCLGAPTGWLRGMLTLDPVKEEDATQSWAAHVAAALGAEHSNISYSGIGVKYSFPSRVVTDTMNDVYDRAVSLRADSRLAGAAGAPGAPRADLCVMYIAGNDYFTFASRPELDARVSAALTVLIGRARRRHPGAPVLVLHADPRSASSLGSKDALRRFSERTGTVLRKACEDAGGAAAGVSLRTVQPRGAIDLDDEGDWGAMLHWSARAHLKWAAGVLPLVEELTGWTRLRELEVEAETDQPSQQPLQQQPSQEQLSQQQQPSQQQPSQQQQQQLQLQQAAPPGDLSSVVAS
jgi:hypothetical protein